ALGGINISDKGLAHFKDCKELLELYLPPITNDAGLAHFKDFPKLQKLHLPETQVTDAGLLNFNNRDLTEVNLNYTRVSDAALAYLAALPKNVGLLLGNTRISKKGYTQLKTALAADKNFLWSETNRVVAEEVLRLGGKAWIGAPGKENIRP